ncbi:ABC transporter permease [Opitutus terrae]|uniref:Transport permease protein n=1 Tax=Opitutus terrae (strain DSM 11246 / JCM 15787 / PB90-1) TaxID=452637 RepID=B1ZT70_OPITP|nr:ABC transporter permease [Opitutus terrae]ACB76524.1 ABC-2 type transporter [Opitutus terrae PB90-1]
MSVFNPTDEIVIRPNQSWLRIDWRGLLKYRDLVMLMVRRDFIARYKQTILGPAWFVINPVLTSLTFTLVFSRVLGVSTSGVPPVLFYLSGMLGWSYFSNLMHTTSSALLTNASLFGKVYFPRLIVPISMSISSCIAFAIQLCTLLAVVAFHSLTGRYDADWGRIGLALLILPTVVLHTAMLALGVGLSLASITVKYRDFQHLVTFLLQIWMYLTPVIFPFSRIQARFPDHAWLAALNPMSAIVENIRSLFFGLPGMPSSYMALSIGVAVTLFTFGVLMYQRTARTFIDTV